MSIHRFPVLIPADGALLAGRIHRNTEDPTEPQPGIVVSGSWLTVKEQMADLYAAQLAALGYTVLTFDFRGFGGSEGTPRQTEMPLRKIADIVAATRFLRSLACVRGDRVGYLAVCASAMYAAAAIEAGAPIGAFVSVAGWFHDANSVAPFYGGPAGVAARLERARQAHERFIATGELSLVPAYDVGNELAGMFIPMDYYSNPQRGRIPEWRNEMSELTWFYWLTFDGLASAERLDAPTLFVHGDECVFPHHVRRIHERIRAPKRMVWQPGFQVDFYDRPDLVGLAVQAADELFAEHLSA